MPFSVIRPCGFTRYRPATPLSPELLDDELLLEEELLEEEDELLELEEDELLELLDEELLELDVELLDELLEEVSSPPQAAKLSANTQVLANVIGLRQSARNFIWDIVTYLFYLVKIRFLINASFYLCALFNFTLHPEPPLLLPQDTWLFPPQQRLILNPELEVTRSMSYISTETSALIHFVRKKSSYFYVKF